MLRASPSDDTSPHDGNQRKLLWLKLEWTFNHTVTAVLCNFICGEELKDPPWRKRVCKSKTSPNNAFICCSMNLIKSLRCSFSGLTYLLLREIKVYSTVCVEFRHQTLMTLFLVKSTVH